jgi:hypothetical protein
MSDHLKLAPVTVLPVITCLDLDAQRVVQAALDAQLNIAIVIGRTADGEFYFASSKSDGGDVLWEIETARLKLMGAL